MIVESPAKAKTIAGYLGAGLHGRVVDRPHPRPARTTPRRSRPSTRARRGRASASNVDHDFEPLYVVDSRKKKVVSDLKAKLKNADELLLATDEDREGEAIAWHLLQVLEPKVPVRRMVFHEITRPAIEHALTETRDIDKSLVDAQETRRILDRLYGYEVSPVLWRKIMQGLSAGRVQSVATRLVVERERERMLFVAADYWDIVATSRPGRVHRAARGRRRRARRAGPRLRPRRRAADSGRGAADRGRRARARRRRSTGADVRGHLGRGEAVHAPPRAAVHDLDAAAGGEPQAAALVAADDARRPAALRERLHHLHAHRLDDAVGVGAHRGPRPGARALRRRAVPAQPRRYEREGEERAGGARGDPSGRRPLPHARRGAARARRRRVQPLRPDLEAHGRLADGGRARADRLGAHRRRRRATGGAPSSRPPAR